MDELAPELHLDAIELRLRNFTERSTKKNLPRSSNGLRECYRAGAEQFDWNWRTAPPRSMRSGRDLVGFGHRHIAALPGAGFATLYAEGSVVVRSAASDMGPGIYTQ